MAAIISRKSSLPMANYAGSAIEAQSVAMAWIRFEKSIRGFEHFGPFPKNHRLQRDVIPHMAA
ncbi:MULTISPECIES: hypothetical protein [unclassified Bradyrhizobium]|uniref:hypothetical protein n=1 Tax=unclassified Bradyrhizobium TaxID=2631580 RepID=UPI002916B669|nr:MULTISPECIES: hypothetical protein [unclassified Bradyrhizobium]